MCGTFVDVSYHEDLSESSLAQSSYYFEVSDGFVFFSFLLGLGWSCVWLDLRLKKEVVLLHVSVRNYLIYCIF
jgi:hypothetical protein